MQNTFHENVIYPPNRFFDRSLNYSEIPIKHRSLCFIDFNSKKQAIVGSSNINGTLWEGTTLFFTTLNDLLDVKWSGYYIGPTACDGKFINDQTVAIAEDTGDLKILQIDTKSSLKTDLFFRNYSRVPQIAVWNNSSRVLTCSDRNIVIFDVNSSFKRSSPEVYVDQHSEEIHSVDTLKCDENCFVSCGADKRALIWDKRDLSSAQILYNNEFAALTSIAWNQKEDNFIVVGTEGGDLYLIDKREPNAFLEVYHCFKNRIHRISFDPNSSLIATCGDTEEIIVLDNRDEQVFRNTNIFSGKKHDGIVRGLAWCDNELYSCGFDGKVHKHQSRHQN